MRIVTWNCRSAFDKKASALFGLRPDLAVVPESGSQPDLAAAMRSGSPVGHAWVGDIPSKGLGVFRPGGALRMAQGPAEGGAVGRWSVACESEVAGSPIGLLAVWTVPLKPSKGSGYLAAATDILRRHTAWLKSRPTIIAGDFNASGQSDPRTMASFVRSMSEELGLVSAYHAFTGEAVGEERAPTLWWRGKREAGFHCDFVFVPATWRIHDVRVGGYDDWGAPALVHRSDHAPVIVDVEPDEAPSP